MARKRDAKAQNLRQAPRRAAATYRHSPVFGPSCRPAPPPRVYTLRSRGHCKTTGRCIPGASGTDAETCENGPTQQIKTNRPPLPLRFGVVWVHPEMGSEQASWTVPDSLRQKGSGKALVLCAELSARDAIGSYADHRPFEAGQLEVGSMGRKTRRERAQYWTAILCAAPRSNRTGLAHRAF